jgi:hypothetical protein
MGRDSGTINWRMTFASRTFYAKKGVNRLMLTVSVMAPRRIRAVPLVNTCVIVNGPVRGCDILGIIPGLVKSTLSPE